MTEEQQKDFLSRLIDRNRDRLSPDSLREWRMREEERHLNQIRSFHKANNWSL